MAAALGLVVGLVLATGEPAVAPPSGSAGPTNIGYFGGSEALHQSLDPSGMGVDSSPSQVTAFTIVWPAQVGDPAGLPQSRELRRVNTELLNLRGGPGLNHAPIGELAYGEIVEVLGDFSSVWVMVRNDRGLTGFVSERFLLPVKPAVDRDWCAVGLAQTPANGEVLFRRGRGLNVLRLRNGLARDIVVRLATASGTPVYAAYIHADTDARLAEIPDGTFALSVVAGVAFSRSCGEFTADIEAVGLEQPVEFQVEPMDSGGYRFHEVVIVVEPPSLVGGEIAAAAQWRAPGMVRPVAVWSRLHP